MIRDIDRRAVLRAMVVTGISPAHWTTNCGNEGRSDDEVTAVTSLRDHGADPTGRRSATAAFRAALTSARRVEGRPGDIYLIDGSVDVPAGRSLVGNGAMLRIGPGVIGLRLPGVGCTVRGWNIHGDGGLYAVLDTGRSNRFEDNGCTGAIGHFYFASGASDLVATGNVIDGSSVRGEITTGIAIERSTRITVSNNRFTNIPVGWGVQIRDGSHDFIVSGNRFLQQRWFDSKIATAGQRIFHFEIGSICFLKKVQVNGKPLSSGYSVTGNGPAYTVLFDQGRRAGERIALIGYRGAENIQINTGSHSGIIRDNVIDGTGDSGIVCHGSKLIVAGNDIRRCGYAGIAIYGGERGIIVRNNAIADCAQLDDGLSSPDHPRQASAFAGAILASGDDTVIEGNSVRNDAGTMRYAVRINNVDMVLRVDGSAAITIRGNRFVGTFADGAIFAPNQTPGKRVHSVLIDGAVTPYPGTIDLDQPWVHALPPTPFIRSTGLGRTWAVRDPAVGRNGRASLRTVAGEHVDFQLLAAASLRDHNVTISFWAKAAGGSSFVSVFTSLAGLLYPLTADITERAWRYYCIRFPFTADLDNVILIRCGAKDGSANIADIKISGQRLAGGIT